VTGSGLPEIYRLDRPMGRVVPFLINSPHSGHLFPESFLAQTRVSARDLLRTADLFVDRLGEPLVADGATLMRARFARAFVDLNRSECELDPLLIEGELPAWATPHSLRVAGGLGVLPRVVNERMPIYAHPISLREAIERLECFHRPYHRRLRAELDRLRHTFGRVVLIDLHSMPSGSRRARRAGSSPDIVLGDRFGTTCAPDLIDGFEQALNRAGFSTIRNQPYAGGFITEHYGAPLENCSAVQIEINRGLYLDEARLVLDPGFAHLKSALTAALREIFALEACLGNSGGLHFQQSAAE